MGCRPGPQAGNERLGIRSTPFTGVIHTKQLPDPMRNSPAFAEAASRRQEMRPSEVCSAPHGPGMANLKILKAKGSKLEVRPSLLTSF